MRIIGIDPGTVAMGYGVLDSSNAETALVDYGVLTVKAGSPIGERLSFLYNSLVKIISDSRPDVMAIEQPFVGKNARSALAIGRAQAIAILAAANQGIPAYEYTPTQVKQRVTSYGAGSKEQVQEMVRLQLGLAQAPRSTDASDALAVALCHITEAHLNDLLSGGQ